MAEVVVPAKGMAAHGLQLSPNIVTTVRFTDDIARVEIIAISASDPIYFTTDGSEPTIGGTNCRIIPPAVAAVDYRDTSNYGGVDLVKIISAGSPVVSVQRD